jgi:hypothetical protein
MAIVFHGDNSIATLKNAGLGVCFGQCTFFAKISKERDCVKTDVSTIQSNGTAVQALFKLDSGSYSASRDRLFGLHGLTAGQTFSWNVNAVGLANYLVASHMGQIVFIDVTMPEGRHVVAARLKAANQLEYFDSNDALFRETTQLAFVNAMATNFAHFSFEQDLSFYSVS